MNDAIRANRLSRVFSGDPDIVALADGTLSVASGEVVAIVGPSGAGKSTLLNLLGLLDTPTAGSYEICGQDTRQLSGGARDRLRATEIGFVFQAYHVLGSRTSFENVWLKLATVGTPRRDRAEMIHNALGSVGLSDRTDVQASLLSGGEKQRLAIARATVEAPTVLLADEPTGNLDEDNALQILALLRGHAAVGTAVVAITHDPQVAQWADRIVHLSDGVIVH